MKPLVASSGKSEGPKTPEPFIDTVVAVGPKKKLAVKLIIEYDSLHRITGLDYQVNDVAKKAVVKNDLLFAWAEFEQTIESTVHDLQALSKGTKPVPAKKGGKRLRRV